MISHIRAKGMVKHNPTVTVNGEVRSIALAQRKSAKNEMAQLKSKTYHTFLEGGLSLIHI